MNDYYCCCCCCICCSCCCYQLLLLMLYLEINNILKCNFSINRSGLRKHVEILWKRNTDFYPRCQPVWILRRLRGVPPLVSRQHQRMRRSQRGAVVQTGPCWRRGARNNHSIEWWTHAEWWRHLYKASLWKPVRSGRRAGVQCLEDVVQPDGRQVGPSWTKLVRRCRTHDVRRWSCPSFGHLRRSSGFFVIWLHRLV